MEARAPEMFLPGSSDLKDIDKVEVTSPFGAVNS
jgi:hypothetical protein